MRRNTRFISVAIFAGLVTVVGASLTWACTPSTFGTPATPAAPPTPTAPTTTPPVAVPIPGSGVAGAPAVTVDTNRLQGPAASTGTSGAGSTSGAPIRTTGGGRETLAGRRTESAVRNRAGDPSAALNGAGPQSNLSFSQRADGATAGTVASGGQQVFAKAGEKRGKKAAAPSTRSAAGDLWSGFRPGERSSVLAAEASAQPDGLGGTAIAALAVLGLGLAGFAGTAAVVGLRSRRARSRAGSGSTEM